MELRISSPCPKSWDDLVGDDRIRYCGQCRLNVYNFAEMGREEVERIVRRSEGRICGTLFVRGGVFGLRDHQDLRLLDASLAPVTVTIAVAISRSPVATSAVF